MKIFNIFSLLFFLVTTSCATFLNERPLTTQILLIRHAEKESGQDPQLNETGRKRAKALTLIKDQYLIAGIYTSDFKRTRMTGEPLAATLKLEISKDISPMDHKKLLDDILSKHLGKTVLVVGHSNTVPAFINFVINEERLKAIDESDFSNLYLLKVRGTHSNLQSFFYDVGPNGDLLIRAQ